MQGFCEAIVLVLVILAPWAYGSVEAWAELGLYAAVALLTLLGFVGLRRGRCWSRLCGLPSLALGALTLLACFQAAPLGIGISRWLAPSATAATGCSSPVRRRASGGMSGPRSRCRPRPSVSTPTPRSRWRRASRRPGSCSTRFGAWAETTARGAVRTARHRQCGPARPVRDHPVLDLERLHLLGPPGAGFVPLVGGGAVRES